MSEDKDRSKPVILPVNASRYLPLLDIDLVVPVFNTEILAEVDGVWATVKVPLLSLN